MYTSLKETHSSMKIVEIMAADAFSLILAGNKIAYIKLIRSLIPIGLKEAKIATEDAIVRKLENMITTEQNRRHQFDDKVLQLKQMLPRDRMLDVSEY